MEKNDNKVKLSEKFILSLRRKWLVNGTKTFLIIAILVAGYIALNLWINKLDLPEIDVTENKIYTLSDASKKAIENVNQDVKMYAYGFDENDSLIRLLKQYNKINPKITYEILTEENNYEMIKENELQEGYHILIIESGDSKKVIDASYEFYTYDNTTYQEVDTTEQTITNSILALNVENKPKVYFMQGHGEYTLDEVSVLTTYLNNEAFEVQELNAINTGKIPDDCDVLAILSPTEDFYDAETEAIKEYINKGGNIFFTIDVVSQNTNLPNLKSILDEYGVSFENGYILENDTNYSISGSPNIFNPQINSTNDITADIYSDSRMWLVYAARLQFASEDELQSLNVTKEDLLTSSEKSTFITDIAANMNTASGEQGSSTIASIITKTIGDSNSETNEQETSENNETNNNEKALNEPEENNTESNNDDSNLNETENEERNNADSSSESTSTESKLVICATGNFISNYKVTQLSSQYPISYLEGNKDFAINSIAELADKDYTLTIRKDITSATYAPTVTENTIVLCIIFITPVLIIIVGVVIGNYRKKRK